MEFPYEYGSDLHWLWGWGHIIETRLKQTDVEFHQWEFGIFRPGIMERDAMTRFSVGYPIAIQVVYDGLTFTEKMFAEFLADPAQGHNFGDALLDLRQRIATSVKTIADAEAVKNSTLAETKSKTKATPGEEFAFKSESLAKVGIDAAELSKVCSAIEVICDAIGLGEWTAGLRGMVDDAYAEGLTCGNLSRWATDAMPTDRQLSHSLETLSNAICDLHLQNEPSLEQLKQASAEGVTLHWNRDMQKVNNAVRNIRACVSALKAGIYETQPAKGMSEETNEDSAQRRDEQSKLTKATGKRAATVNERMAGTIMKNPEAMGWNSAEWAKYLKCGKPAVVDSATWKKLKSARLQAQAERMKDRRRKPKGSDGRRD